MITALFQPHLAIGPQLSSLSTSAVYLVMFGFVLLESALPVGLVLPGDSLLFGAGLLAAVPGSELSLPLLVGLSTFGAIVGGTVGYEMGRRAGRPWLLRRQGGALNAQRLERAERFTATYGWMALVVARFLPWLRSFAAPLAGVTRMRYVSFATANVVGAAVWSTSIIVLGYYAYQISWLRWAAVGITGLAIAAALALSVLHHIRRRAARRAAGDRRDSTGDPHEEEPRD